MAVPGTSPVVGLAGSTGSTTFVLVALLLALGVGMVVTAVWLVRSTRSDAPALGPLEVMGDRSFSKAQPEARSTKLTEVRPEGSSPPAPMIPYDDDEAVVADVEPAEPAPAAAETEAQSADVMEAPPIEPADADVGSPTQAPVGEDR